MKEKEGEKEREKEKGEVRWNNHKLITCTKNHMIF